MDKLEREKLFTAVSIIVGTCIGIGFLGIPYIAAQTGFLMVLLYLLVFASIILFINLYFGEVILRTKKPHQLTGYADRYLGHKGKTIMQLAISFAVFSAIIAYMFGVGESLSYLFLGSDEHSLIVGTLFGIFMAYLLWGGLSSLKRFERLGVGSIFFLFFLTLFTHFEKIDMTNIIELNPSLFYLPIGIILFSLIEFYSLPEVREVLRGHEHLMKKAIFIGTFTPVLFYAIFTFVVVGTFGEATPEIATFALGNIFILIGIIAMFTSYLALGTALKRNFVYDLGFSREKSWFIVSILPIVFFLISKMMNFTFSTILSLGGVIAGGTMVMLVLIINKRAVCLGDRTPEYFIGINNVVVIGLCSLFLLGMVLNIAMM